MVETVLFVIFAITALYGAISMVWARNPVYSALGLMLTMFSLAVFYVSNAGHFVAVVQVIVYTGAVMTLFLFVIMLIGVDKAEDRSEDIAVPAPDGARPAGPVRGRGPGRGRAGPGRREPSPTTEPINGTIEAIGDSCSAPGCCPSR